VLVATSTISTGINLPAKAVIFKSIQVWHVIRLDWMILPQTSISRCVEELEELGSVKVGM
jgi:replicative superfamily II helicase